MGTSVATSAASASAIATANDIRILPDQVALDWPADRRVAIFPDYRPADALDQALAAVTARYGERTADVVAMQLEYPRKRTTR